MNILVIAPKSYPVSGAEAIVNMKMLQAFSRDSFFEIDLVSRKYSDETYPTGSIEEYGVKINKLHIVESCNKLNLRTAWQSIMSLFIFGCTFKGCVWACEALPVIKDLIKNNKYDLVLTKNSPSFLLGAYLHKRGIRWVASWNDPFPWSFYPAPYGLGAEHKPSVVDRMMIRQMKKADYHVFPSSRLLTHMEKYLQFDNNKAKVIPHVVLQNKTLNIELKSTTSGNCLKIIHSGNLCKPRDPRTFFDAAESILRENREVNLSITILGRISSKDMPSKEEYPFLNKCFSCLEPVSYNESLNVLANYNLACVIEAPCKEGEAVFLPTKVTDFMQIGIPIMSISPLGGVLYDMYSKGEIGYFGNVHEVADIKTTILRAWSDFINGGLKQNVVDISFHEESVRRSYKSIVEDLT